MSSTSKEQTMTTAPRFAIQTTSLVVGIVFLVVAVAGFIPGITTNYSTMEFAGHMSDAKLLGLFQVSVLHNIVHLLFGIAGLVFARTPRAARHYLIWGGVIYLVLWVYGLFTGMESAANFVPLNTADNWLHFGLGIGMIILGLLVSRRTLRRTPSTIA